MGRIEGTAPTTHHSCWDLSASLTLFNSSPAVGPSSTVSRRQVRQVRKGGFSLGKGYLVGAPVESSLSSVQSGEGIGWAALLVGFGWGSRGLGVGPLREM